MAAAHTPSDQSFWYVRKHGWVQGPFTSDLMRRMYGTSWLGPVDRVSHDRTGPWREFREFPDLIGQAADESPAPVTDGWEVAPPLMPAGVALDLGMLQMLAATGRLRPQDRVRRQPDGAWQPARLVEGIFGGRRAWCIACRTPTEATHQTCTNCGAAQPEYEPSFATVSMVCGLIAFVWHLVAVSAIFMLAVQRITVLGSSIDESFPQALVVTLIAPFWLAIFAVVLGHGAVAAVGSGRSPPADRAGARAGMILGWATLACLLVTVIGVVSFSLPNFRIVH